MKTIWVNDRVEVVVIKTIWTYNGKTEYKCLINGKWIRIWKNHITYRQAAELAYKDYLEGACE